MLGIGHQHGRRRELEPGADPRLFRSQRRSLLSGAEPGGVVWLGKPVAAAAELWTAERVFDKVHADASRLSMMRMVARSIMVSEEEKTRNGI